MSKCALEPILEFCQPKIVAYIFLYNTNIILNYFLSKLASFAKNISID